MMKNMLNRVLVFGTVFCGVLFCGGVAFSCSTENGWAEYETCMQQTCAERGGFFNGSACVKCAKGTKPSQKLGACVSNDTSEEEEEERYQKEQAEKERIKSSCSDVEEYDESQNKCVFSPFKFREKKEAEAAAKKAEEEANKTEENDDTPKPAESEELENIEQASGMEIVKDDENSETAAGAEEGATEEPGSELDGRTMTKEISINGETEVKTEDVLGGSGGSSEGENAQNESDTAGNQTAGAPGTEGVSDSQSDKKEDEQKKEDTEQYDGLYNGFHIIPDIMAMHCKIKGEDVAKDPQLFIDCIKQYVTEMNSENASAKAEAEKEFEILRYKVLTDSGATAITKSQVVSNHTDTSNEHFNAQSDMKTESDDNKGIMDSLMFITDILNDIRELEAEHLKYMVITGIGDIDPSVIAEGEKKEDKNKENKKKSTGGNSGPNVDTVNVEVKI